VSDELAVGEEYFDAVSRVEKVNMLYPNWLKFF